MTEPISSYALLSDCQGAALVSRSGSVDWACLERFDAPSLFGRLLGDDAGHFSIRPVGLFETRRHYLEDTLVLRTEFVTPTGSIAVTDALVLGDGDDGHSIGRSVPHVLVRTVEALVGSMDVAVEVVPRPEYGMTTPRLVAVPGGWRTVGGPEMAVISSTVELAPATGRLGGTVSMQTGDRVRFAVQRCSPWSESPETLDAASIDDLLATTTDRWRSWSSLHQSYEGAYPDLVRHSGRVLQALTYAPTGAVIAAATTSLPETPGGERNWDYRYCWVRDASLTMDALWIAACPREAARFFEFLATAAGTDDGSGSGALQILYGVGGERRLAESTLDHLDGYGGARPVRVGNGAWDQTQLDVYGELLNAACTLATQLGPLSPSSQGLLIDAADTAARRWHEPDQGIWEVRGGPRHFLYSKLMCWVALDRAVRMADLLDADDDRTASWARNRDELRAEILEHGWNVGAQAFTQAYGSGALDASALMIPIVGFLPADDPRMTATIDAVATHLTDDAGMVYRYQADDGLDGNEGTFAICSFWLVHCLALLGRTDSARELFDRIAANVNDVGLLSEEIDPATGDLLGNFPQAFTHIGLINAAYAITEAERAGSTQVPPTRPSSAATTAAGSMRVR